MGETMNAAGLILSFDDGLASQYDIALPALTALGVVATAFIISNDIDDADKLTTAECVAMDAAGWDISNHLSASTYLNATTIEPWMVEVAECDAWLHANNLERGRKYLAYPGGHHTYEAILALGAAGFYVARIVDDTAQSTIDSTLHLKGYGINASRPIATTGPLILAAKNGGYPVSMTAHKVLASGASGADANIADITDVIEYAQSLDFPVYSFSQWYTAWLSDRTKPFLPVYRPLVMQPTASGTVWYYYSDAARAAELESEPTNGASFALQADTKPNRDWSVPYLVHA